MSGADDKMKILLDGISKTYSAAGSSAKGGVQALAELHVGLRESEIFSIVGPTGCGKSTTLNMIAGFEFPTTGQVLVDGGLVKEPGPERAVVFQRSTLFPWLTVLENVVLGVKCRGVHKDEYLPRALGLLEDVGLNGFTKYFPYQLSGGMQQRVQIVRALVSSPQVLLMDEPFGALDYQTRILMQLLLLRLWEEFRPTVFFITHDVSEALFISDRVGIMSRRPGRIKTILDVPIPKPRTIDILTNRQFIDLQRVVLSSVQEEILQNP